MKTTSIKSWFCDVLAMPILLGIMVATTIEVALAQVLLHVNMKAFVRVMGKPGPWRSRAATLGCESAKPEPPSVEGLDHAAAFLAELEAGDEDAVAGARELLERTGAGKVAVDLMHDKHDYAVAVPTKSENLRRIANVFAAIPDRVKGEIVDVMRNNRCHWMFADNQES